MIHAAATETRKKSIVSAGTTSASKLGRNAPVLAGAWRAAHSRNGYVQMLAIDQYRNTFASIQMRSNAAIPKSTEKTNVYSPAVSRQLWYVYIPLMFHEGVHIGACCVIYNPAAAPTHASTITPSFVVMLILMFVSRDYISLQA